MYLHINTLVLITDIHTVTFHVCKTVRIYIHTYIHGGWQCSKWIMKYIRHFTIPMIKCLSASNVNVSMPGYNHGLKARHIFIQLTITLVLYLNVQLRG